MARARIVVSKDTNLTPAPYGWGWPVQWGLERLSAASSIGLARITTFVRRAKPWTIGITKS